MLSPAIINSTFESPIGTLVSNEAFNGDRYWAKSSNESLPTMEELSESVEQYQGFYNENLTQQFSVEAVSFMSPPELSLPNHYRLTLE